jgi:DNA repair exonuclease SbcCD ATPase subunit
MRLHQLRLHDFRCFQDLDLTFDKPVNFIFGPNASGKSTIAEAMEMAFTGRCNGFNPGWKERSALARQGSNAFRIDLAIDLSSQNGDAGVPGSRVRKGLKIVHRPELKECSPRPEEIAKKLGTSKEVLAALFDTGHFFSLHPDEKKRIVFDLLGLRVTRENIEAHLKSWLRDKPGLCQKHRVDPEGNLVSILGDVPESLEQAYQQAFDERRLLKREMKSVVLTGQLPEGVTLEGIREKVEEVQEKLTGHHTRLGELKGMAVAEKRQLEKEMEDASSTLERLRAETNGFDKAAEAKKLKQLEEKRIEVLRTIEGLNKARKNLESEISLLYTEETRKNAIQKKFESFDGACPVLLEISSGSKAPSIKCKSAELLAAVSKIGKALQSEIAEIRSRREKLQQKIEGNLRLLQESEREIPKIDARISELLLRRKRQEETLSRITELESTKATAEKVLSGLDQEKVAESERIKGEVAQLQGELETERRLLTLSEQHQKKAALEKKVETLEFLTLAFSPKGIMADLLSSAVKSLNASLAKAMEGISGGKYSMEMHVNEDVDLFLIDHGLGTRTGIRLISASERFRAGIVLQSVLSKLTGLRFMLIDGLDILDQENRGFFFRFIQEVKSELDSIFVFSTIGRYYPKNPGLPEIDFWIIEDGKVTKIPEEKKAA